MGRCCLTGYLTEECKTCPWWADGSNGAIGCAYPGPIMNCEAFAKMYEEDEREEQKKG